MGRITAATLDGRVCTTFTEGEIRERIAAETAARTDSTVCFFAEANFQGESFCAGIGSYYPQMPAGWEDQITSIRVGAGAFVQVCQHQNYNGWCERFAADGAVLEGDRNNAVSSFRVYQ